MNLNYLRVVAFIIISTIFTGCATNQSKINLNCMKPDKKEKLELFVYTYWDTGVGVAVNPWSLTQEVIYNNEAKIKDNILAVSKSKGNIVTWTSPLTLVSQINSLDVTNIIFLNANDNTVIYKNKIHDCDDFSEVIDIAKKQLANKKENKNR